MTRIVPECGWTGWIS